MSYFTQQGCYRRVNTIGSNDPLVLSPRSIERLELSRLLEGFQSYTLGDIQLHTDDGILVIDDSSYVRMNSRLGTKGLYSPATDFMDYDENRYINIADESRVYMDTVTAAWSASNVGVHHCDLYILRSCAMDNAGLYDSNLVVDGLPTDGALLTLRNSTLIRSRVGQLAQAGPVVIDFSDMEHQTLADFSILVDEKGVDITHPDQLQTVVDTERDARVTVYRRGDGLAGFTLTDARGSWVGDLVAFKDIPDFLRDGAEFAAERVVLSPTELDELRAAQERYFGNDELSNRPLPESALRILREVSQEIETGDTAEKDVDDSLIF